MQGTAQDIGAPISRAPCSRHRAETVGERLSVAGSRLPGGSAPLKRRGAVAVCLSVTRGALPSSPALPAEGPASLPRFSVVAFTRLGAPETTLSFSAFSGRLGSWRGPPSGGHPHPAARGLGTGCRENVPAWQSGRPATRSRGRRRGLGGPSSRVGAEAPGAPGAPGARVPAVTAPPTPPLRP